MNFSCCYSGRASGGWSAWLLTAFLSLAWCLLAGCSPPQAKKAENNFPPERTLSAEERLGIQVVGIRWSAAGYMLDFRFKVLDPERATPLVDRKVKPYLIHQKSGARFMVPSSPKVGPLRQTTRKPQAGKTYFVLFANPGKYAKRGDRVTVVFKDIKIENLVVE